MKSNLLSAASLVNNVSTDPFASAIICQPSLVLGHCLITHRDETYNLTITTDKQVRLIALWVKKSKITFSFSFSYHDAVVSGRLASLSHHALG